ncbi:flagellar biosynthesis protein FlhB [Candidatus Poribacteria bacterium]|jgi:flagellar biosynthesis protein FlhB|nr:flagellar biosynthesis protein FlhB [Candidatus Poribacteria bacterium]MBT5532963.1 flagellar biosynthesis protein FlhB [Candidatus Poribacteria bacterium]MBT5715072.1 flagellar biosynthesis protein FlhB [Candidatus Poribacteria bacterium]MBT7098174.1 flagellar biosynthesis protein FlhB [Candidatus Poribacteria bacterium]MBT7805723.1 flagellar biosynthesis protein FlhB [Candidatus Poribacteria bacterium]
MADEQEKTEDPSPRKIEEAREEGTVARSPEVPIALGLLAAILALRVSAQSIVTNLEHVMKFYFSAVGQYVGEDVTIMRIQELSLHSVRFLVAIMGPLFLTLFCMGLFSNLIQVGPMFSVKALMPKLSRVSLGKGLGSMFSQKSIVEAVKGLLKVILLLSLAYRMIINQVPMILALPLAGHEPVIKVMTWLVYRLALVMVIVFTILAAIDYVYQRWRHFQNLRMSREEVKEETKQYEGDPQTKGRIRSIQRDLARQRMMGDVPEASVVITNPTEIAVALKYEQDSMEAPRVVAKGQRLIAQRIKALAKENRVPIMEDKPLARAIYAEVPLGGEIGSQYYRAVAEILAYVYRLRRPMARHLAQNPPSNAPTPSPSASPPPATSPGVAPAPGS